LGIYLIVVTGNQNTNNGYECCILANCIRFSNASGFDMLGYCPRCHFQLRPRNLIGETARQ
jgi:hypothetical protein